MSADFRQAIYYIERVLQTHDKEELRARLAPKPDGPAVKVPGGPHFSAESVEQRWEMLPNAAQSRAELLDPHTVGQMETYKNNIENFIGTVKIPIGLAGPLRVNGVFAQGDFYIPLATTEAALVGSYSRGSQLVSEAGGCTAVLLNEGVSRAPGFAFRSLVECGEFVLWAMQQLPEFHRITETTTSHGKLKDLRVTVEGNHVYLSFEFSTGDASGQNMVTMATEAICDWIQEHTPVQPQYFFVEANLSGDKKASASPFCWCAAKR